MSHTKKRTQVIAGRPAISSTQKRTLRIGNHRPERNAEAAMPLRLSVAQDDDADRDQHEGEERADVRHLGERAHVEQAGRNRHQDARDPGRERRRAEARMHPAEDVGQQPVARHGEPDARLTQLKRPGSTRSCPSSAPIRTNSRTQCSRCPSGVKRQPLQRVDHRRRVARHRSARAPCRSARPRRRCTGWCRRSAWR